MTTASRLHANRLNSTRSTGPRTPAGRERSSRNALKLGLFSRLLVLPALGETADECDAFRRQIVADLAPAGALEAELADRAALLLWRLRRVARCEAAAMAAGAGPLPPHPDDVPPMTGNAVYHPLPPDAPPAVRLSRLRTALVGAPHSLAYRRTEAAVLDVPLDPAAAIDCFTANKVLWAAADELGWPRQPYPWTPVLAAAGLDAAEVTALKWTGARLLHVLGVVADGAGCDRDELVRAARVRLHQDMADYERDIAENRVEEVRLVAGLLREREAAAAARAYADDGLVQRVARAEGHLSRELDRALALLTQRQAGRRHTPLGVDE